MDDRRYATPATRRLPGPAFSIALSQNDQAVARHTMDPALTLLAKSDLELGRVDPIVQDLLVAKGLTAFADLDIDKYVRIVDGWTRDFRKFLAANETNYDRAPQDYKNDIRFFRLVGLH